MACGCSIWAFRWGKGGDRKTHKTRASARATKIFDFFLNRRPHLSARGQEVEDLAEVAQRSSTSFSIAAHTSPPEVKKSKIWGCSAKIFDFFLNRSAYLSARGQEVEDLGV